MRRRTPQVKCEVDRTGERRYAICMMQAVDLSGTWKLRGGGVEIPVRVPGDQYSALAEAGVIPDPYIGLNEQTVQVWREYDWSFSRDFELPDELLDCTEVFLRMDRIDTVAAIVLNGELIARCSNMFRSQCLPVRSHLHAGLNRLEVTFSPAHREAAARAEAAARELGMDLAAPVSDNNRLPNMNMLRKVQCHAGWDWGPCLMVCGLCGRVELQGVRAARLVSACTESHPEDSSDLTAPWRINLHVRLERVGREPQPLCLCAELVDEESVSVDLAAGSSEADLVLHVAKPKLWYPAGQGEQALYELRVRLYPVASADLSSYLSGGGSCDDELQRSLGLRKLEVIRCKDDIGESFAVSVNDRKIFCKGANWIPCDALPERQKPEVYERLLRDARAANMNMLRVWGGGQWEQDCFYELCDRLGLLLWHDCMFACMHYPATESFLADISAEIREQILRLRDHPCIALWCGDNECAGSCAGGEVPAEEAKMQNYLRFNACVGEAVRSADPTRLFWPSSPCNGEGSLVGSWHDDTTGDMHYWAVWHGSKPFESYLDVRPRFCSEFGFQSFPSLCTVNRYTEGREHDVEAPVMTLHQKQTGGNKRITRMFEHYFHHPRSFEDFLYLSQVQQALAMRTAVEYWRHSKPVCMGTLYWQLNDNWPVASWSSVDYYGQWKQLHYHAARFYAPVAVAARKIGDEVALSVVSDLPVPCRGNLRVRWMTFEGGVLSRWLFVVKLAANAPAEVVGRVAVGHLNPESGFLVIELDVDDWQGRHHAQRSTCLLRAPRNCRLAQAEVKLSVEGDDVVLSTDKPVFYLTVEAPDRPLLLSDNSVTLLPHEQLRLRILRGGPLTADQLRCRHLRQTYR